VTGTETGLKWTEIRRIEQMWPPVPVFLALLRSSKGLKSACSSPGLPGQHHQSSGVMAKPQQSSGMLGTARHEKTDWPIEQL